MPGSVANVICCSSAGEEQQGQPAAVGTPTAAASVAAPTSPQQLQEQQPQQERKEQHENCSRDEEQNRQPQQKTEQPQQQGTALQQDRAKPKPGRKRKVAMHMAYLGAGYHGMQRNPGFPTIEAELESALVKLGAISEQNAGSFMKIHWMRAARTDKGVSAACQVVSAKLVVDPTETFAERVNTLLPKQIHVFGVQRATEGFDARKFCDKRKYEYILPAWAFDHNVGSTSRGPKPAVLQAVAAAVLAAQTPATAAAAADQPLSAPSAADNAASKAADGAADATLDSTAADAADKPAAAAAAEPAGQAADDAQVVDWTADECASSSKIDQAKLERIRAEIAVSKVQYTFGDAELQRLRSILKQYEGTHNFHNYTVRMGATDPAARRFIRSFDASMVQINGEPWVKLVVVGQSFMLHQIRKMVGTALAVMREVAAPDCLQLALDPDRDINTPMAPALGLFLDETYYDAFNKKFGHLHGDVTFEPFRAAAEQFKQQMLYPHIANTDAKELINALWLRQCTNTNYKFTKWGVWRPVRSIGAQAKAEAAARRAAKQDGRQQGKRPADAADDAADDIAEEAEPAAKQQRLERLGRLDGATAPMVVGMQETYGMAPHRDTERAAEARKELKAMRSEYDQFLQEGEQPEQRLQQQQQQEQQPLNADEALDSLYDLI